MIASASHPTAESPHADRLLVVIGAVSGACVALSRLASAPGTLGASWLMVLIQVAVAAQGGAALLWVVRSGLRWLVRRVTASHAVADAYERDDTNSYAVFLLTLATAVGVQLVAPVWWTIVALFVAAQWLVLRGARPVRARDAGARARLLAAGLLLPAWGASMIGALTWQRMLVRHLGITMQPVTLIVMAALLGVGVGALVGERLARAAGRRLTTFALLEGALAVYALASAGAVDRAGAQVTGASFGVLVLGVLALVALPALLTGAAVPLLTAWVRPAPRETGRAAARLMCAAFLGAALAVFALVDVIFAFTGLRAATWIAAALHLTAALAALVLYLRRGPHASPADEPSSVSVGGPVRPLPALAGAAGVLLVGEAALWTRIIGSANDNRPESFAHAIGVVLLGLAAGVMVGERLHARLGLGLLRFAAVMLALSGATFYVAMPTGAAVMLHNAGWGRAVLLLGAAGASAAVGSILAPLVAGMSAAGLSSPMAVGRTLLALLIGAAVGPLVTGYVLLDVESIEHAILIVALAALGVAQALWLVAPERRRRAGVTVFSLGALLALAAQDRLFVTFLERIHFGALAATDRYVVVAQGHDGIVGVTRDGRAYGDGLYEGTYSLEPEPGTHLVHRAFFVPALHAAPRRVLQIGLGTGVWSRIVADTRGVDSLTVVEPTPAFVDVLWHYPAVASVLNDARVRLHIDDPRRWLALHPDRRFDVIVMTGPWHWRSGASHELSANFLQLVKAHLAPGGIAFFNTTGSLDALYTASGVWRHVMRVSNFAAASDAPLDRSRDARRAALLSVVAADGAPRIRGPEAEQVLEAMLEEASGELAPALRRANDLWNITDDNMAPEFKAAGAGVWWRALPRRTWRPDRAWPTILF